MPANHNSSKGRRMLSGFLGDWIESALTSVGITKERVEKWIGKPCGCEERKAKLNALDAWVRQTVIGKNSRAAEHLESLMNEEVKEQM